MADQFEQWLSASLAPDQREPDRAFTALVQAQIALDRQLDEVARASRRRLALEVLAIAATAAGAEGSSLMYLNSRPRSVAP